MTDVSVARTLANTNNPNGFTVLATRMHCEVNGIVIKLTGEYALADSKFVPLVSTLRLGLLATVLVRARVRLTEE